MKVFHVSARFVDVPKRGSRRKDADKATVSSVVAARSDDEALEVLYGYCLSLAGWWNAEIDWNHKDTHVSVLPLNKAENPKRAEVVYYEIKRG